MGKSRVRTFDVRMTLKPTEAKSLLSQTMRLGCVEVFQFLVSLSRCLVEKGVALCDLPQLASLEELERAFSMLHSEHTRASAHHKHRIDTLEARVRGLNTRPVNQESSQV